MKRMRSIKKKRHMDEMQRKTTKEKVNEYGLEEKIGKEVKTDCHIQVVKISFKISKVC